MKYKIHVWVILSLLYLPGYSQLLDSTQLVKEKEYTSLEEALKNPEEVYKLNLRKKRLKEFPFDILKFKNLQELNLYKNRIRVIPKEIGTLESLQKLNLSHNKIQAIPKEIGNLSNLNELIINQNDISYLPPETGNLTRLYFLDCWGTYITSLPAEISKINNTLKTIDLRIISMNIHEQRAIIDLLPKTKIYFSKACKCQ